MLIHFTTEIESFLSYLLRKSIKYFFGLGKISIRAKLEKCFYLPCKEFLISHANSISYDIKMTTLVKVP